MDTHEEAILYGGQFKRLLDEQTAPLRERYDLKKAELEILYFLSRSGGHNTSSDIYHQLMMNKGHISQAVDSLCKRNLIRATHDKTDRRYVHFEILDSAQTIIDDIHRGREEMNRRILEGITEEERAVFRSVTSKIRCNIEKMIYNNN